MPVPLPLLHAIPLPAWRALLAACTAKPCRAKTLDAVAAAVAAAGPAFELPLRRLRTLSTDDARATTLAAARALAVDTRDWPRDASAPALAAFVVTRAATDDSFRTLIEAVGHALCRREPVAPTRRYVAASTRAPDTSAASLAALGKRLERANEARHAVGRVELRVVEATGTLTTLDVVRPEPVASSLVRVAGGALETSRWIPIHVDRIVLDRRTPGAIVLTIATTARELLGPYREAIGDALLGDAALFARARPLSLRWLQRGGRTALDVKRSGTPRLRSARVVSALWDPGKEETLAANGRDVLAAIDREELPLHGLLVAVVIRLDFVGGDVVDVTLRVPNVVHWEPSAHDDAVRAFLAGLHLDDDPKEDYLALAPFDLPAWRWREALGDAVFEALLAKGLFTRSTTRALAHPDAPSAGRVSLAFPLGRGGYYVVPEEGLDVAPWLATDADLVTYQLDVIALARGMAGEAGLAGEGPRLIERGTLVDLGERAIGSARVRAFLVVGVRSARGLRERLVALSAGAHPVLIVPPGYRLDAGVAEVELASFAGPYAALAAGMARALKLEATLDAWARAPAGTRVVAEREGARVWLDGVELVALIESSRRLARILAESDGAPMPSRVCDRRLSKAEGDGASKQAKLKFPGGVRESFALVGREAPADVERIIEGTRRGYRLRVKAWVG